MPPPSTDEIKKASDLYEQISAISDDEKQYANPSAWQQLPFPFIGKVPSDRFDVQEKGTFAFMGRENFPELREAFAALGGFKPRELLLFGTMGFGKSHIVAALVCLLLRKGKRVVFLPDCKAMLSDPVEYVKLALLLALHGDDTAQSDVANLRSSEDLQQFCKSRGTEMLFIVDQFNAFDSDSNDSDDAAQKKATAKAIILKASTQTVILKTASANNATAREAQSKQMHHVKLKWFGGFSEVGA
jgi:hypothetical protein